VRRVLLVVLGLIYGAGFFTNLGTAEFSRARVRGGMPPDSFFASGTQGQRIVIAPAERLVGCVWAARRTGRRSTSAA
jgi:hypothetical protein